MKDHGAAPGGVAAAAHPVPKRRSKGQAAAVFVLVGFSMLVPLLFVFGFLTRYSSGYFTDDPSLQEISFEIYHGIEDGVEKSNSQETRSVPPDKELYERIEKPVSLPAISQKEHIYQSPTINSTQEGRADSVTGNNATAKESSLLSNRASEGVEKNNNPVGLYSYETDRSCELEFGSYCLWSREHREVIKDSLVKKLKDQLFEARAYYPSVAKLKGQEGLSQELKMNIQDHERMLSEAVSDDDLQSFFEVKIQKMDEAIAKARAHTVDCYNVDKKLRQILDLTEDEAHFHTKQSAFLYQLGVLTMSKTFHCLSMRLTVEYFKSPSADTENSISNQIDDPRIQHYVIFSRNILALSVTINSTVVNSEDPDNMVFHVLTNKQNFYSMKQWFAKNSYGTANIHVVNINELKLKHFINLDLEELSMSEEFRVSTHVVAQPSSLQTKVKYISVFGHCHFLLSDLFTNLKKIIVLDDDVVVQRDISFLWNLDLGGKVNGAVEFCGIKLNQLKSYLGTDRYDGNSCAWMSGINVLNLEKWREHDITGRYQRFLHQRHHENEVSWRAAAIQASLLVFHDQIYALDDTLIQQGLGHDFGICSSNIENAAVLHYDGNMKPWLDLGISKYKKYWKKYLTQEERFMEECNVNI
ncbi:putative galacturonosyltransferase 7 isoform X2 [Curcuma longa]|uniref:putative galacturonosyltransferase 7 isoform X2 n=1 Tax=Curcuma longa TaxID=136217 RepID=UPI003D9F4084